MYIFVLFFSSCLRIHIISNKFPRLCYLSVLNNMLNIHKHTIAKTHNANFNLNKVDPGNQGVRDNNYKQLYRCVYMMCMYIYIYI